MPAPAGPMRCDAARLVRGRASGARRTVQLATRGRASAAPSVTGVCATSESSSATAIVWRIVRRARRSPGQSLVEFAIVLPVFLVIVVGVLDTARVFTSYVALVNAV